jgi:ADP-ribose pyrophosphatase YjhB (NUDIX family)
VQFRTPGSGVAGIAWEDEIVNLLGVEAVRAGLEDATWEPAREERRVLLVRRRGGRHPGWCIPCGWVEYDEEIRSALVREMQEETGLEVTTGALFAVHSNFHEPGRQSVGTWFAVTPVGGCLRAGDDADRLRFCPPGRVDVPLAFPTDVKVLGALAGGPPGDR